LLSDIIRAGIRRRGWFLSCHTDPSVMLSTFGRHGDLSAGSTKHLAKRLMKQTASLDSSGVLSAERAGEE